MAVSTVVNAAADTYGNGGRKLVRLSNGWLVATLYTPQVNAPQIYFYVSKDNGLTFSRLCWTTFSSTGTTLVGFALASKGTNVYSIATYSNGSVRRLFFDALTVTDDNKASVDLDASQTSCGSGCSLAINSEGTELHAAWSSKNSTYPNSFNIRYAKGTIDANGSVTWGSAEQVTTSNATGTNNNNPCIVYTSSRPVILVEMANTNTPIYQMTAYYKNGSSWTQTSSYLANVAQVQANPCAVVDGNGVIHVVWHGADSIYTSIYNVRYSSSVDGGQTWSTIFNVSANTMYSQYNPSLSVDKKNNVYVFWEGRYNTSSIVNDIRLRSKTSSGTWSTTTNLTSQPNGGGSAINPSSMEKEINGLIGWVWKDSQTSSVKFDFILLNQAPTLTLTNPSNNLVLSEGNSYSVQGSATDLDNGNVVTIKYKINNGATRALNSGVSNGSTPISFAKSLTYHDKRLWDGTTDVVGVDLAEGTNHTLYVWAEDDQGGVSIQVTRTFTVIWNRPPTISGADENLGTISASPSKTYSVTDPEGNSFTITEYLDGEVLRTFAGEAGKQYTVTIPQDKWIRTPLATHTLKVRATDNSGMYSDRVYTFVRTDNSIVFQLTQPFSNDAKANRVLFTMDSVIPTGATLKVETCNNAYDASPTWEDITSKVLAGRGHTFANTTKTATKWAINIRVTIQKGTATQPVIINGFGGAFD
ncbi:Ig-like domain-containing protein [Brevibacillus ginsengisoli]|uniref:Ig-like domain-containing protein n=1 Tax=Brevibacillus ginsengisoli TaxID=363854 RepID=UPI003CEC9B5F